MYSTEILQTLYCGQWSSDKKTSTGRGNLKNAQNNISPATSQAKITRELKSSHHTTLSVAYNPKISKTWIFVNGHPTNVIIQTAELFFNIIFFVEIVKIISFFVSLSKNKYLKKSTKHYCINRENKYGLFKGSRRGRSTCSYFYLALLYSFLEKWISPPALAVI